MKQALASFFSGYASDDDIRDQIRRRLQGYKESFSDFVLEIMKMNGRLQNRFSEREMLSTLFQNMQPALRNVTLAHQGSICSIETLRVFCQGFEKLWDQTGHDPRKLFDLQYRRRPVVNEIECESNLIPECSQEKRHSSTVPELSKVHSTNHQNSRSSVPQSVMPQFPQLHNESLPGPSFYDTGANSFQYGLHAEENVPDLYSVSALQNSNSNQHRISADYLVCWNCQDLGHRYQDCSMPPQREFCYGCGAHNVRKPNCMRCQSKLLGNGRPNVTNYPRGSRSVQQATNQVTQNSSLNPSSKA